MSKRKVQFAENDESYDYESAKKLLQEVENMGGGEPSKNTENRRFKEKHSLDSDEEDEEEDKNDILQDDDIEGQEEGDVNYDEGVQFTPFNMKEELEEGHFNQEGMYIPKKEDNIRDEWLDNINWVQVKEVEGAPKNNSDDSEDEEEPEKPDEIEIFKQMLELMKPGENVLKALRRLGGGKAGLASSSASQRWKTKKQKAKEESSKTESSAGNKEGLLQLIGHADQLLSMGNLEIYQDTYEKLSFKVKVADEEAQKKAISISESFENDMFADDANEKGEEGETKENGDKGSGDKESKEKTPSKTELMWEYRWKDEEGEELHGPYNSTEMMNWAEEGYFKEGVFCRKVGSELFYNSKRIDFELYT